MSAPRKFSEVVGAVIGHVPRTPSNYKLVALLAYAQVDSWFQPPESNQPWLRLRDVLQAEIGEPKEPWHFQVIKTVQGQI